MIRMENVGFVFQQFQMVGKKDLFPTQLSGGEQQQAPVARAVIAEPRMILADEPTGSLHWSQGERIMELLSKLNAEGTTIIQVTHDEGVAHHGSRTVELSDGWITTGHSGKTGWLQDPGDAWRAGRSVGSSSPRWEAFV
ncbi:MAG: ATP-binding cassette domain-containing protein [Gemmatimonadales bacterium]|nr:MAG: ATP-binding cassette domain-containing protein [Gemmatimonadales bacterium]